MHQPGGGVEGCSIRDRPQVFVADDAFGSTEYRPDAAERWARELGRMLACSTIVTG